MVEVHGDRKIAGVWVSWPLSEEVVPCLHSLGLRGLKPTLQSHGRVAVKAIRFAAEHATGIIIESRRHRSA